MRSIKQMGQITKWTILYSVAYTFLCVLAVRFEPKILLLIIGLIGVISLIVNMIFIPYKRKYLFASGLIVAFLLMHMGIWIGCNLKLEMIISMGAAVSVMDVLSFTKYGAHTVNANLMKKQSLAAKLVIYGKEGIDSLIPTLGMGDLFFYALWISGASSISHSIKSHILVACAIVAGTIIDNVLINALCKKEGFKGFPATIIPFILTAAAYTLIYFVQ